MWVCGLVMVGYTGAKKQQKVNAMQITWQMSL